MTPDELKETIEYYENVSFGKAGRKSQSVTAQKILSDAADAQNQRAALRDAPNGERSASRAAAIYNAWTDSKLTEADIWRVLLAVKLAREIQGAFCLDDYVDGAGYFSLLGESLANGETK